MIQVKFNELNPEEQEILCQAKEASNNYHNPKGSHYVGTALRTADGSIFKGAAIRRQSASSNTCSERMAIDQAIYNGKHDYKIFAIIGINKDGSHAEPIFPCGSCRQIILEFYPKTSEGNFLVSNSDMSQIFRTDIHELLPSGYESKNLKK